MTKQQLTQQNEELKSALIQILKLSSNEHIKDVHESKKSEKWYCGNPYALVLGYIEATVEMALEKVE